MIANYRGMEIRPGLDGPARCPASRRPCSCAATTAGAACEAVGRRSPEPGETASWRCAPAGPRCSAATSARRSATARCFAGGWYLTGDLARRDADGYFWFVGRGDDVIKSAGHLIGPFEVESALMEHPAVAEAGVIGKPDPVAGEIVKAFVALRPATSRPRSCAGS